MNIVPRILRYMRCLRCLEEINAALWSDSCMDCPRCGIFHLSDSEEYALTDR